MIESFISQQDLVRLLIASALIVLVIIITRYRDLELESDLVISTIRAFVQLMILALALTIIFDIQNIFWIILILIMMMSVASYTAARRARGLPDAFWVCSSTILISSGTIILVMAALGVLEMRAEVLIPLGGMVIGNTMNITALAMDRLKGEVENNVLRIENLLALGATSDQAVLPLIRKSVRASLIPTVDNMKTLGLVWIPGLMSGMLIAGSDPGTAAVFQLIIILMILASNTLASVISTAQMSSRMFSRAYQLTYRP